MNAILKRAALCALFVLFASPAFAAYYEDPAPGDGSAGNPYVIDSVPKLRRFSQWIAEKKSADLCYRLSADIDLSHTILVPIGSKLSAPFRGKFDGGGHVIRNFQIPRSGIDYVGLFGYVDGAEIWDIGLIGFEVLGRNYVGPLAGRARNATIERAFAIGSVSGESNVGGLVGCIETAVVRQCFSAAEVRASRFDAGGLVASAGVANRPDGEIRSSYASGPVTGETAAAYLGGLLGTTPTCQTVDVYAAGSVRGEAEGARGGGLVGRAAKKSALSNAAFDQQGTGRSAPAASIESGASDLGAAALPTDALAGRSLPAPLSPDSFTASKDGYPQLTFFAEHPNEAFRRASALSAVPVFFTAQSTSLSSDGVLKLPLRDSSGGALRWELSEGRGLFAESGEPNRRFLLLERGAALLAASNDERGGRKRFFVSADVARGVEIVLTAAGSADCEAVARYNGVSLDRAMLLFTASGDAAGRILSRGVAADEDGVARYELPSDAPIGSYDVRATLPGTPFESNSITLRRAEPPAPLPEGPVTPPAPPPVPTPQPPVSPLAPDDHVPDEGKSPENAPDVPNTPDEPSDPGEPEPRPDDPSAPEPAGGDSVSDDKVPGENGGGCDAGAGGCGCMLFLAIAMRVVKTLGPCPKPRKGV